MNRSKIEWCDHTWNPITGCLHSCEYCYARLMAKRFAGDIRLNKMAKSDYRTVMAADESRELYVLDKPMLNETGTTLVYPFGFEPTLHRYRYNTIDTLKNGHNIFVGAMADVFGKWVPDEWIKEVIQECVKRPQHNYLFLTKNPDRYISLLLGENLPELPNMWYGATVTNSVQAETAEATMQDLPSAAHAFLSIEPLMEDVSDALSITIANFTDWVIVGAETGRNKNKMVPKLEWIEKIVQLCDEYHIPVFMKDSLIPIVGEKNMRREFPEGLKRKILSEKLQNKLYDTCCVCKDQQKKQDMVTLLARRYRNTQPKQYGFMCVKCFENFCNTNSIEIPEFKKNGGLTE